MLPVSARADLARHIDRVRKQHARDLAHGAGWVELPWALGRKYPNAGHEWPWQWVFPATRFYVDHHRSASAPSPPRVGRTARHPGSRAEGRNRQARDLPHAATLVRYASPRGWLRHPHGAGAPRPPRRQHDNDLHARPEPGARRGTEPGGSDVSPVSRVWKITALHGASPQDIWEVMLPRTRHRLASLQANGPLRDAKAGRATLRRAQRSSCYVVQERLSWTNQSDD